MLPEKLVTSNFKGNWSELSGHTFYFSNYKQAGNYVNTVKHISEYVGANCKHSGDISASMVIEIRYVVLVPTASASSVYPNAPTNSEQTLQLIFKGEIDGFIKKRAIMKDNTPLWSYNARN